MSTPPLNTGNIGLEQATEIGNSTRIVRVEFGQTPFPAVNYTPRKRAAHFAFLDSAKAQDAYAYFTHNQQSGHN